MTNKYLEPGDIGSFDDIPMADMPSKKFPGMSDYTFRCPKCLGHGRWNLELNAYGHERHFVAGCSQCNGYGYVREQDSTHTHLWVQRNIGHCMHELTCSVPGCNRKILTDSSD